MDAALAVTGYCCPPPMHHTLRSLKATTVQCLLVLLTLIFVQAMEMTACMQHAM